MLRFQFEMADNGVVPRVPSSWKEVVALSMKELRSLLQSRNFSFCGRATKVDLQYALCNDLKISPSGDGDCNASALEKASIPLN